jgi:potassium-dependent mechanosensitive channel
LSIEEWRHEQSRKGIVERLHALVLAVVLAVSSSVAGADGVPPDPSQLAPDWWSYFVAEQDATGEPLADKVQATAERLTEIKGRLSEADRRRLAPKIDTFLNSLVRYRNFIAEEPPAPPPATPARDTYTVAEIKTLIEEMRRTGVELARQTEEIALLEEAIAAAQRDLSERKVAYRALADTAPGRLEQGLDLMQSQVQLELGKRELEWRRAASDALGEKLNNLQALVEAAAHRLTASEEAIQAARQRGDEARERAKALREEFLQAQLAQSGRLALSPAEEARSKLAEQRLIRLDAAASAEEISAAQAEVVAALLQRIARGNESDPESDREQLNSFDAQLEAVDGKIREWRRATARNRETALARISEESDPELIAVLKECAELATATEQIVRALEEQIIGATQFSELMDSLLAEREGSVARGIQAAEDLAGASWQETKQLLSRSLVEIGGTPVTATDLFRVLIILTVAWWISKLVRRTLQRIAARRETVNTGSVYTLGRVLHYVILAIGIMIALSSIGIDFTKFALFASALGVGIGFGLQTLVSNFVAGLIILFEKSLKIGDFVELESGVTGEVREINMRSTLITTNDNIDIVVPNSEFVNGRVTNWTMREVYRRIHIPFGVAYGTDKELVRKAALEAAREVPLTLTGYNKRDPQLWFVEFGDSSLNFELVVWLNPDAVKRPGAVQAAYLWEIDNKLRKYDIEVPFPQRDLHLRSVFGKHSREELGPMPGPAES